MRALTKVEKREMAASQKIRTMREKMKRGGRVTKKILVGAGAAGVVGFVGQKFLTDDGELYPNVKGIPIEPVLGLGLVLSGSYADSETLIDAGAGVVAGAANAMGKTLAKLSDAESEKK